MPNHKVTFHNPGELDVQFIKTFGMSAKEGKNPIGFFGTGLKYAIAIILRTGGKVTVHIGEKRYAFSVKKKEMRGKEFDVVTMNGRALPFTTELGKHWNMWQAYRELYCNATDEGGGHSHGFVTPTVGHTTVVVTHPAEPFHLADLVVNSSGKMLFENEDIQVIDTPSAHLFYRGIRIKSFQAVTSVSFNLLKQQELTEDRTLVNDARAYTTIRAAVVALTDKAVIRKLVTEDEHSPMSLIGFYSWSGVPSPEFLEAVKELLPTTNLLRCARSAYHEWVKEELQPVVMGGLDVTRVSRATAFCEKAGYKISKYPVKVVATLGENTWGRADFETRTILINSSVFAFGIKTLAGTLMEEYMHLETGMEDMTRSFQNHIINQLVTMTERAVGEVL